MSALGSAFEQQRLALAVTHYAAQAEIARINSRLTMAEDLLLMVARDGLSQRLLNGIVLNLVHHGVIVNDRDGVAA
jgi:hypothetical protein